MLKFSRLFGFGIVVLFLGLSNSAANAASIDLTVDTFGSEPSFSFSFIHDASRGCDSSGFCMAGARLFRLDGSISGDFDSGLLTLDSGVTLDAVATQGAQDKIAGVTRLDRWTLRIEGGSLALGPANPLGDPAAMDVDLQGRAIISGVVEYSLIDDSNVLRDTGTFYFFPRDFNAANSPNTFDQGTLSLWGNNWDNLGDTARTGFAANGIGALGIDIKANGEVIPEPAAFLLYALGVSAAAYTVRRRVVAFA